MSQLGRPLEPQVCACPLSFGEGMYSTWEHALSTATLPIAGVQAKPEAVSYCAGWDTSADQGHGDSQHWASEMQTHCCPKAPRIPTAATTAAVWMRSWSSRMPVGGSCHGHMLCSRGSPSCCLQGDSPPAALPCLCPCASCSLCTGHPGAGIVGDREASGWGGISQRRSHSLAGH